MDGEHERGSERVEKDSGTGSKYSYLLHHKILHFVFFLIFCDSLSVLYICICRVSKVVII